MDDRGLQKVREILFERLLAGEAPAGLQAQLAARLGDAEAEALMAQAGKRLEAQSADPGFAEAAETMAQRRAPVGRFWRGPIVSQAHAEHIARNTAYGFVAVGALWILAAVGDGQPRSRAAALLLAMLFVGPVAGLWKAKSAVAAGALVVISALFGAVLVFILFGLAASMRSVTIALTSLPLLALWLLLPLSALRAFKAARFLRGARTSEVLDLFD